MAELTDDAIARIAQLSRVGMGPQMAPGANIPYVLVPEGHKVQVMPELLFNEHRDNPERIKAVVLFTDAPSFVYYCKEFSDPSSRYFANEQAREVIAVIDYHTDEYPDWCQHRAKLTLKTSVEWDTWFTKNNKEMTQQEFAEFLEQNSRDITKPTSATIMEVATDLHAHTEAEFGASLRQKDGQVKLKYTETIRTTGSGGQIEVPEQFTVTIPVFVGGAQVNMEALLRVRLKSSKLSFFYTLVRPHDVLREAFTEARKAISTGLDVTIMNGAPPA